MTERPRDAIIAKLLKVRFSATQFSTRSPYWFSSAWPVMYRRICQLVSDVSTSRLRSTNTADRRSYNTSGDRCYTTAGPRLWNKQSAHLRQCDSLGQFKRSLKDHLFGEWDCVTLWRFLLKAPSRNHLTYLLIYLLRDFRIDVSALSIGRWLGVRLLLLILELYRWLCSISGITSNAALFEMGGLICSEVFGWTLRFLPTILHH